MPEALTNQKLL